jgi:hypothetical protein
MHQNNVSACCTRVPMFVVVGVVVVILIIAAIAYHSTTSDSDGWGYMIPRDAEILMRGTQDLGYIAYYNQFGTDHLQAAKQACENDPRCQAVGLQASETIEYAAISYGAGSPTTFTVAPLRWNLFTKKGVAQSVPYTQRVFSKSMWGGW